MRGHQHGRVGAAVGARRCAHHPARATRQLRRYRQHDGRGGQRRRASRHIQADRLYGSHQTFAAHAGLRLHGEISRHLRLMKGRDVGDRGAQRLQRRAWQRGACRGELLGADAQLRQGGAIELLRITQQRRVTGTANGRHNRARLLNHFTTGERGRPGQRRLPAAGIQACPLNDLHGSGLHGSGQHLFYRQHQYGTGAGLLQALERFPENVFTADGVNRHALRRAFKRNNRR